MLLSFARIGTKPSTKCLKMRQVRLADATPLRFTFSMNKSALLSIAAAIVLTVGAACGGTDDDSGAESPAGDSLETEAGFDEPAVSTTAESQQLSERASDTTEGVAVRSTVTFTGLREAMSSQPIVQTITENEDGSASQSVSYHTLIDSTSLLVSVTTDEALETMELPRIGSVVLVDEEGTWEAIAGTVHVSASPARLTLKLDGIQLTSEQVDTDRMDISGVIVADIEQQCFAQAVSERPDLAGGANARTEELKLDDAWETPFCAAQRQTTH